MHTNMKQLMILSIAALGTLIAGCGETKYSDDLLDKYSCVKGDGQWIDGVCKCVDGEWNDALSKCEPVGGDTQCTNDEVRCEDNYVSRCVNGKWNKDVQPCEFGCENGECKEESTGECTNNEIRCNADNSQLEICQNGTWTLDTKCENGCDESGKCKDEPDTCNEVCTEDQECRDGQCKGKVGADCSADSDCLSGKCEENHCVCTTKTDCDFGTYCDISINQCVSCPVKCTDGCDEEGNCDNPIPQEPCDDNEKEEYRCKTSVDLVVIEQCSDGVWEKIENSDCISCVEEGIHDFDVEKVCIECQSAQYRCSNEKTLEKCNDEGHWILSDEECAKCKLPDDGGEVEQNVSLGNARVDVCMACIKGKCASDKDYIRCNDSGEYENELETCEGDLLCNDGTCYDPKQCENEGSVECTENTERRCIGKQWVEFTCEDGATCLTNNGCSEPYEYCETENNYRCIDKTKGKYVVQKCVNHHWSDENLSNDGQCIKCVPSEESDDVNSVFSAYNHGDADCSENNLLKCKDGVWEIEECKPNDLNHANTMTCEDFQCKITQCKDNTNLCKKENKCVQCSEIGYYNEEGCNCVQCLENAHCTAGGKNEIGKCNEDKVCSYECSADYPDKCQGICVNLSGDTENCGSCGNKCISETVEKYICADSQCVVEKCVSQNIPNKENNNCVPCSDENCIAINDKQPYCSSKNTKCVSKKEEDDNCNDNQECNTNFCSLGTCKKCTENDCGENGYCLNGECVKKVCNAGETKCSGKTKQSCIDNAWVETSCQACYKGDCTECNPDDDKPVCINDNRGRKYCSEDGNWIIDNDCSGGLTCVDGVCGCVPGVYRFESGTVQQCRGGKWVDDSWVNYIECGVSNAVLHHRSGSTFDPDHITCDYLLSGSTNSICLDNSSYDDYTKIFGSVESCFVNGGNAYLYSSASNPSCSDGSTQIDIHHDSWCSNCNSNFTGCHRTEYDNTSCKENIVDTKIFIDETFEQLTVGTLIELFTSIMNVKFCYRGLDIQGCVYSRGYVDFAFVCKTTNTTVSVEHYICADVYDSEYNKKSIRFTPKFNSTEILLTGEFCKSGCNFDFTDCYNGDVDPNPWASGPITPKP